MGYSISQETYERMQRYAKEGRVCSFARCYSRARIKARLKNWYYPEQKAAGEAPHDESDSVYCKGHFERYILPHKGGANFELVSWGAY